MKRLLYISLILFSCSAYGQVIQASGSWSPSVSPTAISEAGSDYGSGYAVESLSNQTLISLQRGGGLFGTYLGQWRVDVSRNDINWHSNLQLEIRRTGNGNGTGWWIFGPSISNGTAYQPVGNNNQPFFQGNGIYRNIPIQYRITGLSVLIPADTYSTEVVYTLIEL